MLHASRIGLWLVLVIFAAAHFCPALEHGHQRVLGWEASQCAALTGWDCLLGGGDSRQDWVSIPGWLPNILIILAAACLVVGARYDSRLARVLASLISLGAFVASLVWLYLINARDLRVGYYLWVASIALLVPICIREALRPLRSASQASMDRSKEQLLRPRRSRRLVRLLRRCSLSLCVALCGVVTVRAVAIYWADKRLHEVETELDRMEPGWRWDELHANRRAVADEVNSVPHILAAAAKIPDQWPRNYAGPMEELSVSKLPVPPLLQERLLRLDPQAQFSTGLIKDVRAELKALAPALAHARKVIDLPSGRYRVDWTRDLVSTVLPHQNARRVAALLSVDAALKAQEGDQEGAAKSIRGVIHVARSIGDEPFYLAQLVRMSCTARALTTLERVLAQGELSEPTLLSLGKLLAEEEAQPLLLFGARGERNVTLRLVQCLADGDRYLEQLKDDKFRPTWWGRSYRWIYVGPLFRFSRAPVLEIMTKYVQAVQLPPSARSTKLVQLGEEIRALTEAQPSLAPSLRLIVSVAKIAEAEDRRLAHLRCSLAALAAERYRLANGRWPDNWQELIPTYMGKIPEDPFADKALRLVREDDGLIVASDGMPGFRLWDKSQRRQPAADEAD